MSSSTEVVEPAAPERDRLHPEPRVEPLIFERSGQGKRGYSLPPLDVPETVAIPEGSAARGDRGGDAGLGGRDRAPLHASLAAELLDRPGRLPAGLLHDEAQPAPERGDGAPAGIRGGAPAGAGSGLAGVAGARVAAGAGAGGADRPLARDAAAVGRRAGRARRDPHGPQGAREDGQAADDGADPGLGARHQSRVRALRGLQGQGAQVEREGHDRPCGARGGDDRGRRRPDADRSQHAGRLRGPHPRHRPDRPRQGRATSTATAPTSTRSWASRSRGGWAWTSCT